MRQHKYNAQSQKGKRSKLETACELLLNENGLFFEYEQHKIQLVQSFKFCSFEAVKGEIKEQCAVREMTYTPDFVGKGFDWVIETKGMKTPDFMLKWKLFKQWLSTHSPHTRAYICHSQKDIKSTISHIKCPEVIENLELKKNLKSTEKQLGVFGD